MFFSTCFISNNKVFYTPTKARSRRRGPLTQDGMKDYVQDDADGAIFLLRPNRRFPGTGSFQPKGQSQRETLHTGSHTHSERCVLTKMHTARTRPSLCLDCCGSKSVLSVVASAPQHRPLTAMRTSRHHEAIRVEVSSWLTDHGGKLIKEAVQQYSGDLLKDIEMANAFQQEDLWHAIKKLRKLADQEQEMPKAPPVEEAPSDRDLDSTVLDDLMTCTKQVADLEQRCVGIERELRRVQEAAESCGLAIQNHVEDARSSWDRLSKLEVDINEIQATRTSLAAEQEKMRKVVVSDLIRLAKDKVRTKEDLGMYHFSKTLDQDTGHKVRESTDGSGESGKPEAIVAVAAGTTFVSGCRHALQRQL